MPVRTRFRQHRDPGRRPRGWRRWAALAVLAVLVSGCSGHGSAVPTSTDAAPPATSPAVAAASSESAVVSPAGPSSSQESFPAPAGGSANPTVDTGSASLAVSTAAAAPTPGAKGAAGAAGCPGVRCLSVAETGDVLLHPPLVDQAHADSPGGQGLDFAPMLAAEKPYIQSADLGICHLETPLAPADGPSAATRNSPSHRRYCPRWSPPATTRAAPPATTPWTRAPTG